MCSAKEVSFVNALDGTNLTASAAVDAFFVVNRSKIILNYNCSRGAGFFTLAASNTAVFAILTYLRAFIMVIAGNCNAGSVAY